MTDRRFYVIEDGEPVEAQRGDVPTHELVEVGPLQRIESVRVRELRPGDTVSVTNLREITAIHVATVDPHPLYRHLALVVWRMSDGTWSHDALDLDQVVGDVDRPRTNTETADRLRAALHHGT